jgi:hypothetical protein
MSQQHVESAIHRLLTDEDLRERFAVDRFFTVAELVHDGTELTSAEIDLFLQADLRLWFGDVSADSCRSH